MEKGALSIYLLVFCVEEKFGKAVWCKKLTLEISAIIRMLWIFYSTFQCNPFMSHLVLTKEFCMVNVYSDIWVRTSTSYVPDLLMPSHCALRKSQTPLEYPSCPIGHCPRCSFSLFWLHFPLLFSAPFLSLGISYTWLSYWYFNRLTCFYLRAFAHAAPFFDPRYL